MQNDSDNTMASMVGTWRLVSSEFRTSSGAVLYPLGEDAQGVVIFTDQGYMSAQLMRRDRPLFAAGDQASGTPEEIQAALLGYVAYCGHCEIDVAQQKLTTHVEGSLFPNWVGGTQERYYELHGDELVLKTTPMVFGDEEFIGVLSWKRD